MRGQTLRWVRRFAGRRGYLVALVTILYLSVALPLWISPPVKTHLRQLLSGRLSPPEVAGCGCQQSDPPRSEAEVRAQLKNQIQIWKVNERNPGGESR
ncbi:MAG: hypothetical protein KatS3mg016_1393 [Fimbriimonadales bacterium]|nr:MAG: hypothetical protein KatS3mg016_1393 [Fimbriimonadales bacterium]GIV07710.1 MAG: hypothetical protein KatS3mg017_0912 [Fimbriimonadales bacterium]